METTGSDELLAWIMDSTTDGLWVFDDHGTTTFANPRMAQMLGRAPEEMPGFAVADALDVDGRAQLLAHLEDVRGSGSGADNVECSLLRADGARIWTLVSHSPLLDADGVRRGWLHRVTELTDRKLLLDKVTASEQQLAEAQSIAKVGSWDWDIRRGVVTWSDELYRIYELDPQEFEATYLGFLSYLHPEDRPMVEEAVGAAFSGADNFAFDARIVKSSGREGWIRARGRVTRDETGAPIRMGGTSQEVTEAVLASLELRRVNARHTAILTAVREGIVGVDADGCITFVNVAAGRMLGYEPTALVGRDACEVLCGSPHEQCALRMVGSLGHVITGEQTTYRRSDGSLLPVEVTSGPKETPDSLDRPGVVVTFRDITERLAVEQMKQQFVSSVSHEMRTPLTSTRGVLEMLSDGDAGELPEIVHDLLATAQRGSERLSRLVNDIIDVEKLASGDFSVVSRPTDIPALVAEAIASLEGLAAATGVQLRFGELAGMALCDPDRVEQALVNLIDNAVKCCPEDGVVLVSAVPEETQVVVSVRDNGPGIPEDQLASVFERFHQVNATDATEKGGTGLGLTIARSIVERRGGRIWVESAYGEGTLFSFTLPLAPSFAHEEHAPPPSDLKQQPAPLSAPADDDRGVSRRAPEPSEDGRATAVVAEALAIAVEAEATVTAEAVVQIAAAVAAAAEKAAEAAERARRARTYAAEKAAQIIAQEAARTAIRVQIQADIAAPQVARAAAVAVENLLASSADREPAEMATLVAEVVRAAAEATAVDTSLAATVVEAAVAAAAAGMARTTSALEEAYDSEVTAVADALHDLTRVTAQQTAIDTHGRAEHVASTAWEAAAALRLPRLDGDKA